MATRKPARKPAAKPAPAPEPAAPTTVKVRAGITLTWLAQGETAEVELTPLVKGALRSGVIQQV